MDSGLVPMMRRLVFAVAALALAACAPEAPTQAAASLPNCADLSFSGELTPAECRLQAAGQMLHVTFAALPAGTVAGTITINVLDDAGATLQSLLEPDVSEYRLPSVEDVDGDGRADILIPRATGNVNTEYGMWIYNGERGRYERVGDISGVSVERTSDGYIAVPARSGGAWWNVAFYRLDEGGLHPIVTLQIDSPIVWRQIDREERTSGALGFRCTLMESPGLRDINLDARAAEAKFCAEPAANVYAQ